MNVSSVSCSPCLGQFRDGTRLDIKVDEVLAQGQLLAAHTDAFVHLYEMNVVTGGEVIVELTNTQLGMSALHSVMPTSGAVMAAVLACVEAKGLHMCVLGEVGEGPHFGTYTCNVQKWWGRPRNKAVSQFILHFMFM